MKYIKQQVNIIPSFRVFRRYFWLLYLHLGFLDLKIQSTSNQMRKPQPKNLET